MTADTTTAPVKIESFVYAGETIFFRRDEAGRPVFDYIPDALKHALYLFDRGEPWACANPVDLARNAVLAADTDGAEVSVSVIGDRLTVSGAFDWRSGKLDDTPAVLAFNDGTELHVAYGDVWRIQRCKAGSAEYERIPALTRDPEATTDRVDLRGGLRSCELRPYAPARR